MKTIACGMRGILRVIVATVMVAVAAEGAYGQSVADSLALVAAENWTMLDSCEGVRVVQGRFASVAGAPQVITVARIGSPARPMILATDSLVLTSEMAAGMGCRMAVNGSFFDMAKGGSVCYVRIGGEVRDTTSAGGFLNGCMLIDGEGKVEIVEWTRDREHTTTSDGWADALVSGPMLMVDGVMARSLPGGERFRDRRHPRTAVGTTATGDVLLVTVDGRHADEAEGMTLPQLAWVMRVLGATSALNLDGGGSTTMWTATGGVVSYPSDNLTMDHEGERPVVTAIGVRPGR